MDEELRRLVAAVRDGRITETDRVREILKEARQKVLAQSNQADEDRWLVNFAEAAFVEGWSKKATPAS